MVGTTVASSLNYDSDNDTGMDLTHELFGPFHKARQSRFGTVDSILAVADVGRLGRILIIVPDEHFDEWKTNFSAQAAKSPSSDIYYHEAAMGQYEKKNSTKIERYKWYSSAKITLSKYSVLNMENDQLTDKARTNTSDRNKAKYLFFTKQWSLIIFQNADLIPRDEVARKAAEAAVKLQCIAENYKRVYVFGRAFLQLTPRQQLKLFPRKEAEYQEALKKRKSAAAAGGRGRKIAKTASKQQLINGNIVKQSAPDPDDEEDKGDHGVEDECLNGGDKNQAVRKTRGPFATSDDEDENEGDADDFLQHMHMDDDDEEEPSDTSKNTDLVNGAFKDVNTYQPTYLKQTFDRGGYRPIETLPQGKPIIDLVAMSSKDTESSSVPPGECDISKTTDVHSTNDIRADTEPDQAEVNVDNTKSATQSDVVDA